MNPGGHAADQVGSIQADALKIHEHNYNTLTGEIGSQGYIRAHDGAGAPYLSHPQSGSAGNSTESRPKNAYVYWLIKVKN